MEYRFPRDFRRLGRDRNQAEGIGMPERRKLLEFPALVFETAAPNAMFRVKLENEHEIIASHRRTDSGKNRIRVLTGDKVLVEMTP